MARLVLSIPGPSQILGTQSQSSKKCVGQLTLRLSTNASDVGFVLHVEAEVSFSCFVAARFVSVHTIQLWVEKMVNSKYARSS